MPFADIMQMSSPLFLIKYFSLKIGKSSSSF